MNMLCTPPPQTVTLTASGNTVRRQLYQPVQSKTNCDMRDRDTIHDKTQSSCRITEEGRKVNGNILGNSDKRTDCNETTHSNRCFLKPKAQYELKGSINEDSNDNRNHDSPHSAHRYEDSPQVTNENTKKRIFISSVRKNDNMHTTEKRRKTVLNASEAKLKIIIPESNPLKSIGVTKQNIKLMDKRKAVAVTIEKRNVKEEQDNSDNDDANENNGFSRNLEGLLGLESTENLKVWEQGMVEDTDSTVPDDDSFSNGESNVRIKEEVMKVNKDKEIPMSKLFHEDDAVRINQTSKQIEEDHHEDDASPVEDSKSPEKEDSEWRKYLSPLTPHSGSSSGSSRTVPQMECSSKAIDEKSDVAESDDGTEYYESASEDQNEESGILTNLAKSVWGIFSLSCH